MGADVNPVRRFQWLVVATAAVAVVAGACAGSDSPSSPTTSSVPPPGGIPACELLDSEQVGTLIRAEAAPGDARGFGAERCFWGDADPAEPGHVLSLHLQPAAGVERYQPGAGDTVYELEELGEGAVGVQQAGAGVRVVFTVEDVRVDLEYDVVPRDRLDDSAIDRLVRTARSVRARLEA